MPSFNKSSADRLKNAHPLLQQLMNAAIKEYNFIIADSQRGRRAQEAALKGGFSKVRFGQSAHNWSPALALDIYPAPYDPMTPREKFVDLQLYVIKPIAKHMVIPIRQGIDWNMNGELTDDRWVDLPHLELHPWREFAKRAKPYMG